MSMLAACPELIEPGSAMLVEDMARNLCSAKALGMTRVWIDNGAEPGTRGHNPASIDVRVDDPGRWLQGIAKRMGQDQNR